MFNESGPGDLFDSKSEFHSELHFEWDGVYCSKCGKEADIPYDEPHNCIDCYYCGEHDACICQDSYCERCIQPELDCDCSVK